MKLRLFWVVATLFAFASAGHAAESDRNVGASDSRSKSLTIPSVEMGGGSLGVDTTKPTDPNVPRFSDPTDRDKRVEPFVGLKFTKPLGDK